MLLAIASGGTYTANAAEGTYGRCGCLQWRGDCFYAGVGRDRMQDIQIWERFLQFELYSQVKKNDAGV